MARARNIKPSFFTNEQVSDNCPLGRLLFIGLWTMADYKGDLEWKEKTLKIQLLPWDECSLKELAINLDKYGLVRFYSDGNKIYLNIPNFEKHQNPHKNERDKGSDIPAYSEQLRQVIDLKGLAINRDKSGVLAESSQSDRAESLFLNPDSPILIPDSNTNSSELVSAPKNSKRQSQKNLNTHTPDDQLNFDSWPEDPGGQTWADYKKMRSTKRAWITQTIADHLGRVLVELFSQGYSVDQVLSLATVRNWTGLEAQWVLNNYSAGSSQGPPKTQFLNSREKNAIRNAEIFDYEKAKNF
jgi:hypothetical protein